MFGDSPAGPRDGTDDPPARNRRRVVGGLIAGVALLAAIGLGLVPLELAVRDAEAGLRGVAEQRPIDLGLGVFAVFLIGSLLFIPLTVLILATEVVLGPRVGVLYAYGATLGTSLVVFWGVRRLGGTWMRRRLEGLYVLAVTGLVITGRALWLSWGPGLALGGVTVLGLGMLVYRQRLLHHSGSRHPDPVA